MMNTIKKAWYLNAVIVVACCSIIYELIYAQALTITHGGQVVRYSITIGVYLFFLGVGALYCYRGRIKKDPKRSLIALELILSIVGPAGFIFIILINSTQIEFLSSGNGKLLLLILSHIPVAVVGILSGLELPLLNDINKQEFESNFSETLGLDYFGSLIGTVVYALYLYPEFGLLTSVIVVGLLNLAVVIYFSIERKRFVGIALVAAMFATVFYGLEDYDRELRDIYLEKRALDLFWKNNLPYTEIKVTDYIRTPYQEAYVVDLGHYYKDLDDECFLIDTLIQGCKSWIDDYHEGLIDIPMKSINPRPKRVLVVGGGDWIPAAYLEKYDVHIDMVDIDKKFTEKTKKMNLVSSYNETSWDNDNLKIIYDGAYNYIRRTDIKYDLILLDLPGLNTDKLLHLYSSEFFYGVRNALSKNGVAVAWGYWDSRHVEILQSTLNHIGIEEYITYAKYGEQTVVEKYFLFGYSDGRALKENLKREGAREVRNRNIQYMARYNKPNSVFKPNKDMIVN